MAGSDRKFGVELEFAFGGQSVEGAQKLLVDHGYPEWSEHVHMDGSEVEVDSPILQGTAGFRELREVMELLQRNGASCHRSDGGHIHHDAPEFIDDSRNAIRLLDSWVANRHVIERFVANNRWNSYACPRWSEGQIQSFKKHIETDKPRDDAQYKAYLRYLALRGIEGEKAEKMARCWRGGRADLNLSALGNYGTIEFRLHEGTMDYETLSRWIKFGQRFLANVLNRKHPIPQLSDPEDLLRRLRLTKADADKLLARALEVTNPRDPFQPGDNCEGCDEPVDECYCGDDDDWMF